MGRGANRAVVIHATEPTEFVQPTQTPPPLFLSCGVLQATTASARSIWSAVQSRWPIYYSVGSVAFSTDGQHLVSGSDDRLVKVRSLSGRSVRVSARPRAVRLIRLPYWFQWERIRTHSYAHTHTHTGRRKCHLACSAPPRAPVGAHRSFARCRCRFQF